MPAATPRIDRERSALVLVDYQTRLMPAIHDGERVLDEACRLADIARMLGVRVVGTEQNPAGLGANVAVIRERCGETFEKTHFDGCLDGFADALGRSATPAAAADRPVAGTASRAAVRDVVLAGCEAHVCLLQTALGLLDRGFAVFIVEGACGSRRPADHRLAMQRLDRAGATLASVEMVAFEWLRSSDDPCFREVLQRIK
ncbi:MAG TPA: isochorismatase family protein [Casimicrobiaceae bacterium]